MNLPQKFLLALSITAFLSAPQTAPAAESPDLTLPDTIWAAPKIESNIHFRNLLTPHPENLSWDVTCKLGRQMESRWTLTPKPDDQGRFPLELVGFNSGDQKVVSGSTTLQIADGKAGAGQEIHLLTIGDSLTAGGLYTRELLKLFEGPDEPKLVLLGTRGEGNNRHEGYPGWTWRKFLEPGPADGVQSPFLIDGKWDFSEYIRHSCGNTPPEFIVIFLGTNDMFGLTDTNRAATITKVVADAEKLVAAIRSGAEKAKIGLVFPLPPASQDAFGTNYACGETRRNYYRSIKHYASEMQRQFGEREKDGLYIIPAYLGFDSEQGYPTEQQPVHARSEGTTARQMNALHPAVSGYRQVADTIYSWMKNLL